MFLLLFIHHKFPRFTAYANEIHALGQIRHINLLGLGRDLASLQGLSHQVVDAIGLGR